MTDNETISETIHYLNLKAGTDYATTFPETVEYITSLIKMDYRFEDFKTVIDKKWEQWEGTKFQMYVRPTTLFGKNFENYLNEPRNTKASNIQKLANSVLRAKQFNWKMDK